MTIAIAIIAGVGLVAALALAIADKYLAVREDPRIGMVTAALPGARLPRFQARTAAAAVFRGATATPAR